LAASETNLTITSPHYESHINGIVADEFPLIPEVDSEPIITLPADTFREAVAEVVIAAALDESRPVLAGVHMYVDEESLVLVATDSFRLAECSLPLPTGHKGELSVIVPARTMQELVRLLGDDQGEVKMYLTDNQVMFQLADVEVISRLIEGQFPNYRQIIPTTEETCATLPTTDFTRISKMANLFARENGGGVRVEVQAEGEIRIIASASQVGDNTSSAECEVAGDDGEISLNAKFLSDALSIIKTKEVSFSISGKLNPCVIRPEGDDAHDYLHIIMPLRT
jgi:DNA polymerase-3 subunit beta